MSSELEKFIKNNLESITLNKVVTPKILIDNIGEQLNIPKNIVNNFNKKLEKGDKVVLSLIEKSEQTISPKTGTSYVGFSKKMFNLGKIALALYAFSQNQPKITQSPIIAERLINQIQSNVYTLPSGEYIEFSSSKFPYSYAKIKEPEIYTLPFGENIELIPSNFLYF